MSDPQIDALETAYGIPAGLYGAIVNRGENSGATATSPKGAYGRAQLMPATARSVGVDPSDPNQNLEGGARVVSQLVSRYGADRPDLVAAAYNAGPGAVDRHGGVPPYKETQAYVRRVTAALPDNTQPSDDELQRAFQAQQSNSFVAPAGSDQTVPNADIPAPVEGTPAGSVPFSVDINQGSPEPSDDELQKAFEAHQASQASQNAGPVPAQSPPVTAEAPPDGSDIGKWLAFHFDPAKIAARADAAVRVGANAITGGFADKGEAAVAALPDFLKGGSGAFEKSYSQNLTHQQQLDQQAQAQFPAVAAPAGDLGGLGQAALLPEMKAVSVVGRAGQGLLAGGGLAALNTLGHARGNLGQEVSQAAIPTALGAVGGGLLSTLGGALSKAVTPSAAPSASIQDFIKTGVTPSLAINGPSSLRQVAQTLKGAPFVKAPLENLAELNPREVGNSAALQAQKLGSATTPEETGMALQQATARKLAAMKLRRDQLYSPVNQLESNPNTVHTENTLQATQGMIDEFPNTPETLDRVAPQIRAMHDMLTRAKGKLTFRELKANRSVVGTLLNDRSGLVSNPARDRLKHLYGAMSDDMEAAAEQLGGPQAKTAMQAANRYNVERHRLIDETLSQVMGKEKNGALMPPEQAFKKFYGDAKSGGQADIQQIRQLKAAFPKSAWDEIGSGVIHMAGRDPDGHFNVAQFAREFSGKNGLSPAAKRELFDSDTLEHLETLARVSSHIQSASKFYNHSQSGNHAIAALALIEPVEETIRHLAAGNFHGALASAATPMALAAGGRMASELLASPGFAKMVLRANKTSNPKLVGSILSRFSAKNPQLSGLMSAYSSALMKRIQSNTPTVALANAQAGAIRQATQEVHTGQ
jgi:hypothetical protein